MSSCIIIGAGPGIGEAIARRFGGGGHSVGLIARREPALRELTERLRGEGINADWRTADAGNGEQLQTAIHQLVDKLGRCRTLIYNAAVLRPDGPLDLDPDRVRNELDVNVLGALLAAQCVAPDMIDRAEGSILFTGGGLALEPYPEWTSLALGKAALRSLAFSLFKELAPHGLHVSVIAICGIVASDGPFDPVRIADEYWRVAMEPNGLEDREVIFQPDGSDPYYNDPDRRHRATTLPPRHLL